VWTLRRGQTLASIAAAEYHDARCWRQIAEANGIDDPLALQPGTLLMLPALRRSLKADSRATASAGAYLAEP
jgi:nucleoid-associated protein YgaU